MIFYFSGTGNTRWIVQQLAEATGEELRFIPDEMKKDVMRYELKDGERLGFCFPTHGWQPPRIVREFIQKAKFIKTNTDCIFVWALTTCGDNMGKAMDILNRELAKKGLQAETLFSVIMPESYVCLPFMYTDTENREREKIEQARQQTQHIARIIRDRQRGIVELETLKKTNLELIQTLDEVRQIQDEGRAKRMQAEQELAQIEGELKQKLISMRG